MKPPKRLVVGIAGGGPGRLIASLECGHTVLFRVADLNKTAAANPQLMVGQRSQPCLSCPEEEDYEND